MDIDPTINKGGEKTCGNLSVTIFDRPSWVLSSNAIVTTRGSKLSEDSKLRWRGASIVQVGDCMACFQRARSPAFLQPHMCLYFYTHMCLRYLATSSPILFLSISCFLLIAPTPLQIPQLVVVYFSESCPAACLATWHTCSGFRDNDKFLELQDIASNCATPAGSTYYLYTWKTMFPFYQKFRANSTLESFSVV